MKKIASINLTNFLLGMIFFVLVIVGFLTIPSKEFFPQYDLIIDNTNYSTLIKTKDITSLTTNISCEVTGISSDNRQCQKTSETSVNIMYELIKRGAGALMTLFNSIGISKTMIEFTANILSVPPEIVTLIITALIISIIFAILYVIFGRSDL